MSTILSERRADTIRYIEILDPRGEPEEAQATALAPRPPTLSGLTIGLFDNGKPNANLFLDRLEAGIAQRVPGARTLRFTKLGRASSGEAAPEDLLSSVSSQCRVAVYGIAD